MTDRSIHNVVLVGAGGGIGRALLNALLADAGVERVITLSRQAFSSSDARVHSLAWDPLAASADEVQQALAGVLAPAIRIDTVIYAAGLLHDHDLAPEKRLQDVDPGALVKAFQVNALGLALVMQALRPWLGRVPLLRVMALSAKVGSIGDNRLGGWYAYRMSKAALNMLVANLAIELQRQYRSVACVAVHPGTTRTALSAPFQESLRQLEVHAPEDTAANLLHILGALASGDNGRFLNWDGTELPW
ncbi:SDR family NAD(P)-dependent oxidoreductase [Marinobacter xestospongiae]|uniref:SDR family NAD(P)-dependent oxidoreductase n=1 Tax=Marinobacter xestospongiae TaxID=994319 RepID=A0ABU3VYJ9_9GAMM|nr:SDR family NAD(P)-dependent oxidoreductase [Marinobacter xestospongiae]MDV2078786.1 SDR family NAD(P)-dependent oxidoreductase [Marinobacter xestospongiae]